MREITTINIQFIKGGLLPSDILEQTAYLCWKAVIVDTDRSRQYGRATELGKTADLSHDDLSFFLEEMERELRFLRNMTPEQVAQHEPRVDA